MKHSIAILSLTTLLVACGGGDDTWLAENDSTVRRNIATVTAVPLVAGPFVHYVDVHGNVKADKSAALFAQGGRVRSIKVKAGDRVRAG
ncbi:MAG: efflux RND transporter periplasmic adaptor subunit [Flavobacteriales bacterium]|nr:efflux RND transporter periplasmic adaptor subunit [Flavobacteriales bacterium]